MKRNFRTYTKAFAQFRIPSLEMPCIPFFAIILAYFMQALVTAGLDSYVKLASADPRRLEAVTGQKFPMEIRYVRDCFPS